MFLNNCRLQSGSGHVKFAVKSVNSPCAMLLLFACLPGASSMGETEAQKTSTNT